MKVLCFLFFLFFCSLGFFKTSTKKKLNISQSNFQFSFSREKISIVHKNFLMIELCFLLTNHYGLDFFVVQFCKTFFCKKFLPAFCFQKLPFLYTQFLLGRITKIQNCLVQQFRCLAVSISKLNIFQQIEVCSLKCSNLYIKYIEIYVMGMHTVR